MPSITRGSFSEVIDADGGYVVPHSVTLCLLGCIQVAQGHLDEP